MDATNKIYCQYVVITALVLLLTSCSGSNEFVKEHGFSCCSDSNEFIKEHGVKKGVKRDYLLTNFGNPIESKENEKGVKIDLFVFKDEGAIAKMSRPMCTAYDFSPEQQARSAERQRKYDSDVNIFKFQVTYDKKERVDTVNFLQLP